MSNNQVKESPQVKHFQGMALLEIQTYSRWTIHQPTPVNNVDPALAASNINTVTTLHVQQSVMSVSFASTTQVWMDIPVPPTVSTVIPSSSSSEGTPFENPKHG